MYEKLFEPIIAGNMEIKNRLVVPPMVVNFCEPDGKVTEKFIKYHEERAKGGWGMITIEQAVVSKKGKGHPGQPVLWSDEMIEGLSELTQRVHAAGAKINVQINHAGRQALSQITGSELLGPSAVRDPYLFDTPHELTIEEIHEIVEEFGEAALRAKKAGFDMIMEHAHHGYLIGSFLSPYCNKRSDEYGGSLLNRARLMMEVYHKMREKVGPDYPIACRFSGNEFLDNDEYLFLGQMLEQAGVCMLFLGDGRSFAGTVLSQGKQDPSMGDICANLKRVVSIPVGGAGGIHSPTIAQALIASGKMDFVLMGRPSIADPELPNKVREGRVEDIRHCIDCMQGCFGNVGSYKVATCLVNPLFGREAEYAACQTPANKKKVLVAGGGICGMEAAIIAAERGHEVSLYESGEKLGGQWLMAAVPPYKYELNMLTYWQKRRLDQLDVKVYLNSPVSNTVIDTEKPDAVIAATGATPITPKISGVENDIVVQAFDILSMKVKLNPGSNIVVIGGGAVGSETAAHVAAHGNRVTLIEMMDDIALDVGLKRPHLLSVLNQQNVNIITGAKVTEIEKDCVNYEKNGSIYKINRADMVVLAIGARANDPLSASLLGKVPQVIVAGDAKKVQKAMEAVHKGYEAAMEL